MVIKNEITKEEQDKLFQMVLPVLKTERDMDLLNFITDRFESLTELVAYLIATNTAPDDYIPYFNQGEDIDKCMKTVWAD